MSDRYSDPRRRERSIPDPGETPLDRAGGVGEARSAPPARPGEKAGITRAALWLAPVAILGMTFHHALRSPSEGGSGEPAEERWREYAERLQYDIDVSVDEAFAPVYAGIPALLDSVGSVNDVNSMLLELKDRIGAARQDVASAMRADVVTRIEDWYGREVGWFPPGFETGIEHAVELAIRDGIDGFTPSIDPAVLGADLANRVAAATLPAWVLEVAEIAQNTLDTIGAAAERWLPGFGDPDDEDTDEFREPDELEQGLRQLVDAEKEELRASMSKAVEDISFETLGDFVPAELGTSDGRLE